MLEWVKFAHRVRNPVSTDDFETKIYGGEEEETLGLREAISLQRKRLEIVEQNLVKQIEPREASGYIGKPKKFLAEKPLHLVNDCGIFRVDWHRVSTNAEMTIYSLVLSFPQSEEPHVSDIANAIFFHRRSATQGFLSGAYYETDDCKIVTLNSDHPHHKGTGGWVTPMIRNLGFNLRERF